MESYFSLIKVYVKFYIVNLGLVYLTQKLWNWFEGESVLKLTATWTIVFIIIDLIQRFYMKYRTNK